MRVLHSYCLNYNIGDYALGIGVKNVLRRFLDVELIGNTNLQGRVFDEYYIDQVVNKRYDLLVLGGGGVIHGAHWPNGWFWLIDRELIERIRIPFVVYGVGYNYFKGEAGIPERGVVHLRETVARAAYFSVRNDGSRERLLEQTGIDAPEIPDPGFHVGLSGRYDRACDDPYVIVQVADDKPDHRFGGPEGREAFVRNMRTVVRDLAGRYRVILAPHVLDDVALSRAIAAGIDGAEVWDFGYFAFDHSAEALAYYRHAHLVLSMRGHGQIVPIGFGTPVISLENHAKNVGLMRKLGLEAYNVDVRSAGFVPELLDAIARVERERAGLVACYRRINDDLFQRTAATLDTIRARITAHG